MSRYFGLVVLTMLFAQPAAAIDWPWQEEDDVNDYGYCKGFAMAGLAEDALSERARIDLWLTWNHIMRTEVPESAMAETNLQQGRDALDQLVASGDFQGIRDIADSDCYLGRNRRGVDEKPAEA